MHETTWLLIIDQQKSDLRFRFFASPQMYKSNNKNQTEQNTVQFQGYTDERVIKEPEDVEHIGNISGTYREQIGNISGTDEERLFSEGQNF